MSISYKTMGNDFNWPFTAAKWSEVLIFLSLLFIFLGNNIKVEKMVESLGLGKKSSGPETDTKTWSWFWLPLPKPGFSSTLLDSN